jgi:hypothetical protein
MGDAEHPDPLAEQLAPFGSIDPGPVAVGAHQAEVRRIGGSSRGFTSGGSGASSALSIRASPVRRTGDHDTEEAGRR